MKSSMKISALVLACSFGAACASASGAVSIGKFAGGVAETGWGRWNSGVQPLDTVVYTVTDLDSSGDGGALETNRSGFGDSWGYSFSTAGKVADFFANDAIQFDLVYRGTPTDNAQGGFSQLFQVILQSNYNSNGFTAFTSNYNNGTPVALSSFSAGGSSAGWGAGTSQVQTKTSIVIDYRAWKAGLGGTAPSYLQMWFSTNDSNRIFKAIDNVQLIQVPEPATLTALAGTAGLVLARRRSR